MAIQRHICVGTAAISSSVILKRHDGHISYKSWCSRWNLDQWSFFQCHFRSCKALAIVWLETCSWNEIKRRGWSHCVQFVKTNWLMYILTFLGDHLALRERKLTSNFVLHLSELTKHISSVSMREKRRSNYRSSFFFRSKLFSQKLHEHFMSFWSDLVI